ncbi:MAG: imidazole glycerol phosphate synthase subunit HisH [Ruminococcus sp.]|jgi:glutamine amidotransferase|nr:imidazole glycerol phosphate synthase subunit HisH [Ruminococcus sp.]
MIAIVDYGAGNIFSVKNALESLGIPCVLTDDPAEISNADKVILPGVGSFPSAMEALIKKNLTGILKKVAAEKPFLGICLGMQVLFDKGFEFAETEGLALIHGEVKKIPDSGLVIPHMGWNKLDVLIDTPILPKNTENAFVYFVHSYAAAGVPAENLAATCSYGTDLTAFVWDGKYTYGTQFHPEKSSDTGLLILKRFTELS